MAVLEAQAEALAVGKERGGGADVLRGLAAHPMYMTSGLARDEMAGAMVPASPAMWMSSPMFHGPMLFQGAWVAGGIGAGGNGGSGGGGGGVGTKHE